METMKRRRLWNKVVGKAKRARRLLGAALLAGELMLGSASARADDQKPKPAMELESGVGYINAQKDLRAMVLAKSEIPLPLHVKLNATVGMSGSLNNRDAGLEEVEAKLSVPVAGPVVVSAGYLRSKHGAVENLVNASVFTGLPFGAVGVSGGYLLDFKTVPLFAVFVWNVHPRIALSALGGAVIGGDSGIAGGAAAVRLTENTSLKLDSWNIVNRNGAVVANLKCSIIYRF